MAYQPLDKWDEQYMLNYLDNLKSILEEDEDIVYLKTLILKSEISHSHYCNLKNKFKGNLTVSETFNEIDDIIESRLVNAGLRGSTNPTITAIVLKNKHGYRDKQEIASTIEATITDKTLTDNELEEEMRKRGLPLDIIGH